MAYAPLFHEVHSELFLALCRIINEIHQGREMTRQDILKELPNLDWNTQERVKELIDTLFLFRTNGHAVLFLDKPIHYRPSAAELVWLHLMLQDQRVAFLLPMELRQKLASALQDMSAWSLNSIWQVVHERGDDFSTLQDKLTVIWQALHQKKKLYYRSRDQQGRLHEGACAPCRLEYDAAANRCHLIIWQEEEQRAVKINIASLIDVHILEKSIPASTEQAFQDFLESRRRSVCIEVSRKNNAVERCFMMFASYDKEASYDEDQDIYTLTIYYYDFDREDILQQIISLGAAAAVLSPEPMRQAIIERLLAAWQNIQD
ncbi:WYL domain-containing protein [Mitsuokella sp. WILCCON 0060]|uniref:WYL domain-containing protein n=1 Tax=unclassified Mitsuokella TaxID=2637239 RepID=UPI003F02643C